MHAARNTILRPKYLDNRSSETFNVIKYIFVNGILRMLNQRFQEGIVFLQDCGQLYYFEMQAGVVGTMVQGGHRNPSEICEA